MGFFSFSLLFFFSFLIPLVQLVPFDPFVPFILFYFILLFFQVSGYVFDESHGTSGIHTRAMRYKSRYSDD